MSRWRILLGSTVLLAACSGSPVDECDPCRTSAIAYGSVVDAAGEAYSGRIGILAYTHTCESGIVGGENAIVNDRGEFRTRLSSSYMPRAARCFLVVIDPEGELPDIATDTVELSGFVEFRDDVDESRLDSVRLDVVLPVVD